MKKLHIERSHQQAANKMIHLIFLLLLQTLNLLAYEQYRPAPHLLKNEPIQTTEKPRIQFEPYKALAGETIRLECPQPNPTWFFRRPKHGEHEKNFNIGGPGEDLIVTRHGIINADYKYKIMCHITLKHKVIIINNVGFDEEGLYTCLYTQPDNAFLNSANSGLMASNDISMRQYRYVYNVTVYTLINGLTMEIDQIAKENTLKQLSKTQALKEGAHSLFNNEAYDVIDSTLTVRENDELSLNCVVDSSRPSATIRFSTNSASSTSDLITSTASGSSAKSLHIVQPEGAQLASLESLISQKTNIIQNSDRTYRSEFSARLRASANDHGKIITCKADNGFSNQKWENKKVLNILFKPVCKDPANFVYYIGINQTLNVECRVANANPTAVTYNWNVNDINGNIHKTKTLQSTIIEHPTELNPSMRPGLFPSMPGVVSFPQQASILSNSFMHQRQELPRILGGFIDDGFTSSFKFMPRNMNDFGKVVCTATNEIGSTECSYSIKLGGVPNPPTECSYNMKNTSAIISCLVGFHQGDPDIYCYLLRKSDNGVYKEHTRNRESCSFIVNDVDLKKLNEFWIYSSNKHGHNKDSGVHLTIGEVVKVPEKSGSKALWVTVIVVAVFVFLLLACCFSFKIRKGLSDGDSDSVFESDAYQTKSSKQPELVSSKKRTNHQNITSSSTSFNSQDKMIKGVRLLTNHDSSYDINDHIKDSKLLIDELKSRKIFESTEPTGKTKRFSNLFKTAQQHLDEKDLKVQSLYSDKFNKSSKNSGILVLNSTQRVKKSISFTKPLVNEKLKQEESSGDVLRESTPLYHAENNISNTITTGLLTTVADTNLNRQNTSSMVTFGNSVSRKLSKQQNISGSTSMSSTNASSNSPATSSTNNDSEYTNNNSPINLPDVDHNYSSIQQRPTNLKLGTFSNNSNSSSPFHYQNQTSSDNLYNNLSKEPARHLYSSAPRPRFVDRPPLPPSAKSTTYSSLKSTTTYGSEILETRFLNKLCEDIEVSLNVDCECADDYSSNDFSGDYSFDNELIKTPMTAAKGQYRGQNAQGLKLNPIQQKINNLEQNIKSLRNGGNSGNQNNINNNVCTFEYNGQNKSHVGVLV